MKITTNVRTLAATLITIGSLAGGANAALSLTIADNGGGQTRWQFSGSTTITAGSNSERNGFWFDEINLGGFDSVSEFGAVSPVSGTWSGTSTPVGTIALRDLFIRDSGFGVRSNTDPGFGTGDTISWAGDFVVNVPISNFSEGSFTGNTTIGTDGDFQTMAEGISITVSNVPEPSSTALLGLGGLALMLRRRR